MRAKIIYLGFLSILISGCNSTVPNATQVRPAPNPEALNLKTSRAKRSAYECRVAIDPKARPFPIGLDDFRMDSGGLYGIVDLYGDGSLETISGFSDSTWHPDPNNPLYYGNTKRSREGEDYMMFSSNPDTVMLEGFNFITARHIIPSDLNDDGIDDVVVIHQGPDQEPLIDQSNYVFMSSPQGYSKQRLPGPKATWHGGAIGDIDNDGDLDIVATPSENNRIGVYWNNSGKFTYKTVIGASGTWNTNERFYNAQLWDIDKDGFLDLFVDGHKELASIFWGNGYGFNSKPTRIEALNAHLMEDVLFTDIDNDGVEEIVVLTSNQDPSKPSTDDNNYYYGWGIYVVETEGRQISEFKTIYEYKMRQFLPYFTACDLKNDGDMDLVINIFGQIGEVFNPSTTGMFVFENRDGALKYHKLVSPKFYEYLMNERTVKEYIEEELAKGESLGVNLNGYVPSQVYYPTPDNNKRYLKGDPLPAKFLLRGQYY